MPPTSSTDPQPTPATPEDIRHGAFRLVECAACGVFKAVKPVKSNTDIINDMDAPNA